MTTAHITGSSIQTQSKESAKNAPLEIQLPASKYLANRYIALAAMVEGATRLVGLPENEDIAAALDAVASLGVDISSTQKAQLTETILTTDNSKTLVSLPSINCQDSGTLSRFVTALAATKNTPIHIDASEQMRSRPMLEMITTLEQLGVTIDSSNGLLPLTVTGPIRGGECFLDASRSSQFLSGLLIACLNAKSDCHIIVPNNLVSSTYVDLTIDAIERFSGAVICEVSENKEYGEYRRYLIKANQNLSAPAITVEADVVSSSYFMAAALLAKTSFTLKNYHKTSPQGEAQFPFVLERMGAQVEYKGNDLVIAYDKTLQGIEFDMGNMPDAVPTLAVVAAFAQGKTRITNIAHLAFKESNRIDDLCEQLIKLGVDCTFGTDFIEIVGKPEGYSASKTSAITVSSCHDHRLAMSLALFGIQGGVLSIEHAEAVNKSFPTYWKRMQDIGLDCSLIEEH